MAEAADEASNFDLDTKRAIRSALALDAYRQGSVRIIDSDLSGFNWLVASNRYIYAVSPTQEKKLIPGWFFGIHIHQNMLYLFENCGLRDRDSCLGRIVRIRIEEQQLRDPQILVTGLHGNCHQIAVIDDLLCVVDTANQQILRFTLDGTPVDVKQPFPVAHSSDTSGAYLHINSLAKVGDRIGLILHNGKANPEKRSELAWLDHNWRCEERNFIDGHQCHDIALDEHGVLWHSASLSGEIMSSDGKRLKLSDTLMTRGIAFAPNHVVVGLTTFGPRQIRDFLGGSLIIMDRAFNIQNELRLRGSPTEIISI
jgi:hypothetical protein